MCGIVGSVGLKKTKEFLINGLSILDYRGYDSAGIALINKNNIDVYKYAGTVNHLASKIPVNEDGTIGIGHTRWATHGKPSDINSHPHLSDSGNLAIVHNGVIENFLALKSQLIEKGYHFISTTDTEVLVNLIEDKYKVTNDLLKAMALAMKDIKGSYAAVIIKKDDINTLYAMKNSSPLLIGVDNDFSLIASDATPMAKYTDKYVELADKQLAIITAHDVEVYDSELNKVNFGYVKKDPDFVIKDKGNYSHFMLKEIEEIKPVVEKIINTYSKNNEFNIDQELINNIKESDEIIFIGCGTSYHASLIGVRYFEHFGKSSSSYIASEWAFYPRFPGKKPFIIFLSQSGETADIIHCQKIVKEQNLKSLVITNTKGSSLERSCDYSLLIHAGLEVSVASTKAYVAQVAVLAILVRAVYDRFDIFNDLKACLKVIEDIRYNQKEKILEIALEIKDCQHLFFLGRGYDYDLSLEASLKLKEVSYIHSEAIAGGELKHGPIALIEENTPVIVFVSDDKTAASMRGNIEEVKARGAKVYTISTENLFAYGDKIVTPSYRRFLSSIAISSIAFYLAYYVSLAKGLDVDKPRNLAKSVTVE